MGMQDALIRHPEHVLQDMGTGGWHALVLDVKVDKKFFGHIRGAD